MEVCLELAAMDKKITHCQIVCGTDLHIHEDKYSNGK